MVFFFVLGQNSPQFGGKQFVDLRMQFKNSSGKTVTTKTGVRYPIGMLTDIKGALDASTEMATSLESKSAKVMLYAKVGLIEREIHTLEKVGSNCYGCFVNHPSQKQHMADGGCLEDKVWQDVVANRFEEALLS